MMLLVLLFAAAAAEPGTVLVRPGALYTVQWEVGAGATATEIERRTEDGGAWEPWRTVPVPECSVQDSLESGRAQYRARSVRDTADGRLYSDYSDLSDWVEVVNVQGCTEAKR